nr:reverse transcriptase domain-containing protein [Tanacetum cinerariifolium]
MASWDWLVLCGRESRGTWGCRKEFDEHVTTTSNDPLLSGEDKLKLTKLMELYTKLQSRVLALETTKANQALKIGSLNRRGKILRRRKNTSIVESEIQTNATMADNRTMAQMLQAPIEGYEDAIVVPPINANNFELKQTLINLVQLNQFTERQDPHNHLRFFYKVTSTFRHPKVPNTTVKLLLFPFSLEGEARIWLDKEPPRSILTWEDLVSKFINQFFPPSQGI